MEDDAGKALAVSLVVRRGFLAVLYRVLALALAAWYAWCATECTRQTAQSQMGIAQLRLEEAKVKSYGDSMALEACRKRRR